MCKKCLDLLRLAFFLHFVNGGSSALVLREMRRLESQSIVTAIALSRCQVCSILHYEIVEYGGGSNEYLWLVNSERSQFSRILTL